MTREEFAEACKDTMLYPTYKETVACLTLGLIEELDEVEEVACGLGEEIVSLDDVKGELGDFVYYLISLSHFYGYKPTPTLDGTFPHKAIPMLAKCINKMIRDDAYVLATPKRVEEFSMAVDLLYGYALAICTTFGFTMSEVYEYNVAKLQKRKAAGKLSGDGSNR